MSTNTLDNNEIKTVQELSSLNDEDKKDEKKKHPKLKFALYFLIIIVATGLALFLSLKDDFNGVISSLTKTDYRYFLVILAIVIVSYLIDAFIIFIFSRLYTRRYRYHQGVATSLIGAFYSAITPGSSGGQVMQAYTMKKQGVETSTAASILIMSFIVYQMALISLGVVSLFFSAGELIGAIGTFNIPFNGGYIHIPAIPLTIAGFALNLLVILGLFMMSYSHKFHNFIMNHGINLFAKLHLVKNPDEKRESLRIQVENFKIELRRLFSNIPIFVLVFVCYLLILILRFSIPFFAGLALDGFGYRMNVDGSLLLQATTLADGTIGYQPVMSLGGANIQSFWHAVFLSSYHQMTTGLIPLPGSAGVSEYFFNLMFGSYYNSPQVVSAAQIIWRFLTYHVVILVSGIVSATYRSSPKNEIHHMSRKTFVTMQFETYQTRKASADTMFETASLSRKEIQMRLKSLGKNKKNVQKASNPLNEGSSNVKVVKKVKKADKKDNSVDYNRWDSFNTKDDDDL